MSDFGEGRNVRARKLHRCEWCSSQIVIGERHFHFTGKWQDEFQDWRMHHECEDAHQRETYEGEICDERHQRGRTCGEMEDDRRKFDKELAHILRKELEKPRTHDEEWVRLAKLLRHEVEDWQDYEEYRVDQERKAACAESERTTS